MVLGFFSLVLLILTLILRASQLCLIFVTMYHPSPILISVFFAWMVAERHVEMVDLWKCGESCGESQVYSVHTSMDNYRGSDGSRSYYSVWIMRPN